MLGGATRWMSPELFDPPRFGMRKSRPTKKSDCYALGMVIYEILSGEVPFARHREVVAIMKILDGGFPERPQGARGAWFTDELYKMLESCWRLLPDERSSLDTVLQVLQDTERPPRPPFDVGVDDEMNVDS